MITNQLRFDKRGFSTSSRGVAAPVGRSDCSTLHTREHRAVQYGCRRCTVADESKRRLAPPGHGRRPPGRNSDAEGPAAIPFAEDRARGTKGGVVTNQKAEGRRQKSQPPFCLPTGDHHFRLADIHNAASHALWMPM